MVYDLIIIGGGPAGITAGIYAAREKLNTLLITKDFGGQMTKKAVAIENYPGFREISGLELIERFRVHLKAFKVKIEKDSVVKVKKEDNVFLVSTKNKRQFKSEAVIVASGADPRPLEVPGEKEFIGKGVSYCAVCDAIFFQGRTVAVIGGGDAGFEAALALSKWASKIYILEFAPKVKAYEITKERAKKTGKIEVITNAKLEEIKGKGFVDSIVYLDRKSNQKKTLKVQGVFVEIGRQPATSFVKDLVDFNKKDEIKVDPHTGQTSTPGLFAAGDADDVPYKQIVIAAGEGAKAAISAYHYLKSQTSKVKT